MVAGKARSTQPDHERDRADSLLPKDDLDLTVAEAQAVQLRLRERLVLRTPPDFESRRVAGVDLAIRRGRDRGYAGIVVVDASSLETLETATAVVDVRFPYVPGLLSFRELPAIAAAWARLERRPDAIIFDGQGLAHPRRFGLACHGGLLFGVPAIGCAKSVLVGRHGPLGPERGSTAELVDRGEMVGMAVRTRAGVRPVFVSAGHLMDLDTAVDLVLRLTAGFREPETTRRSHRLVSRLRVDDVRPG